MKLHMRIGVPHRSTLLCIKTLVNETRDMPDLFLNVAIIRIVSTL